MIVRVLAITLLVAGFALAAPADDPPLMPSLVEPVVAEDPSTCDGWPEPVGKLLDECPHGPTP